jgi:hypothetical protein
LRAISTHPSLRGLIFESIYTASGYGQQDRTKAIADVVLVNKQVEEIPFDDDTFDSVNWQELVTPRLEWHSRQSYNSV